MGFRFQRRIKILPGLTVNLSKSGVGVSVGARGFHAGVDGKGRRYTSASLPGTGISWREYYKGTAPSHQVTHALPPSRVQCSTCGTVHEEPPKVCSKCGCDIDTPQPGVPRQARARLVIAVLFALIVGAVILASLVRGT